MEKGKVMMGVIIGLLVLLLATVVGVSIYLFSLFGSDADHGAGGTLQPTRVGREHIHPVSLGDTITINLASSPADRQRHAASIGVTVGVNSSGNTREFNSFLNLLNTHMAAARSVAQDAASNMTYDELRSPEGRDVLIESIMRGLKEEFDTNLIVEVVLDPFIIR